MKTLILSIGLLGQSLLYAQYAPAVGQIGTTAIKADSSIIVNWANSVLDFTRGYQDIANSTFLTAYGLEEDALALAGGPVVSIGDHGIITLGFEHPIKNGIGPDFAVFENAFSDSFLELALIEVSTDGINFVRMPSVSLTQTNTQVGSFGSVDCTKLYNLAGKYKTGYGTPFDLEDIIDSTGVNLDSINYVRVIDAVGTINPTYANYDSQGNIINDPYPTNFSSGGFDLDAIGVINENKFVGLESNDQTILNLYPNPSNGTVHINSTINGQFEIYQIDGKLIQSSSIMISEVLTLSGFKTGIYFIKIFNESHQKTLKFIID